MSEIDFCDCINAQKLHETLARRAANARQEKLNRQFIGAGIPPHFRDFTIDTLLSRAGNDPGKVGAVAAVTELITNGFVLDPVDRRYKNGIILSGLFGVGKTGLLTPVIRHYLDQGKICLWVEFYDFLAQVQGGYSDNSAKARLDAARNADVILLDDLGDADRQVMEFDDRRRILFELINYRHGEGLPTLITTNLSNEQLANQFGSRISDRIIEACCWVEMAGRNFRME